MYRPIRIPAAPTAAITKISAIHFHTLLFFTTLNLLFISQPCLILHTFSASSFFISIAESRDHSSQRTSGQSISCSSVHQSNASSRAHCGQRGSMRKRAPISVQSTMTSVPAPIRIQPIRDFVVNSSCRKIKASTSVMTTLSLSTGTTLEASPICKAL